MKNNMKIIAFLAAVILIVSAVAISVSAADSDIYRVFRNEDEEDFVATAYYYLEYYPWDNCISTTNYLTYVSNTQLMPIAQRNFPISLTLTVAFSNEYTADWAQHDALCVTSLSDTLSLRADIPAGYEWAYASVYASTNKAAFSEDNQFLYANLNYQSYETYLLITNP